jgi:hypothetical protein
VATWRYVCAVAEQLPDAVLGEAHEGSPAWYAGRHSFARLRWDDEEREILQTWTGDMDTEAALANRRETFPVIATFRKRVSLWAYLDQLDERETVELVLDSYGIRGGARRRAAVDAAEHLGEH